MPAFRRRLIQALAVLGALTVLASIGLGVWLGVDQVRQYIAEQDQRIARLTTQINRQRSLISQQQDQVLAEANRLIDTRQDVERLRSGLGILQNVTANQHSYTQLDISDLQNNVGALRTFTSGLQVDTSFEFSNLRTYIERVDQAAIDADYGQDQRIANIEHAMDAAEREAQETERAMGEMETQITQLDAARARLNGRVGGIASTVDQMPSQRIVAGLLPAWLLMLSTEWGGILGEHGEAETVRVRWSTSLADDVFGDYNSARHVIRIAERYRGERPELLAAFLAHEFHHATSTIPYPRSYDSCIEDEMWAMVYEVVVWDEFNLTPNTQAERNVQAALQAARRLRPVDDSVPIAEWTRWRAYVEDQLGYRDRC